MNNTGYSHGLLRSLTANLLPMLVASAGLFSWGAHTIRTRSTPDPFHASIVAVLAWQLIQVDWPYKQYYGPWLLTGAPFFAYFEPYCRPCGRRDGFRLGAVLVVAGALAAASLAGHRRNEHGKLLQQFQEQIVALSEESSPLVAAPPFHPIVRRDVFYAWCRTIDLQGYTTERALSELGYGARVSAERYRGELACREPAVIVIPLPGEDLYDPLQWQIISEFLRRNVERYEIMTEGNIRPIAVKRVPAAAP